METATIVTLGQSTAPTSTSFQEAFGEFSEARGRGRARRQKRRTERIANRKTSRTQRQQGRLEKKKRPENVFSSDEDSKIVDDVDNEISRED